MQAQGWAASQISSALFFAWRFTSEDTDEHPYPHTAILHGEREGGTPVSIALGQPKFAVSYAFFTPPCS